MNKFEKTGIKVFLVVMLWVFLFGFVIPEVLKFASTLLLFATVILTALGLYATVKYLVHLYKKAAIVIGEPDIQNR